MYMRHIYIHILKVYDGVRIIYNIVVYDMYFAVYVCICTYRTTYAQYTTVPAVVYAFQYMHVYACISE